MTPVGWLRLALFAGLFALIAWLWIGWSDAEADATEWQTKHRIEQRRAENAEQREAVLRQAEMERATDEEHLQTVKDDLTHAIQAAPKGKAPAPATAALNCVRLRRAGLTASADYRRLCR